MRVASLQREKVLDARDKIYKSGYVVNSKQVEDLLCEHSLVPTEVCSSLYIPLSLTDVRPHSQNAFSSRLGKFGLQIKDMLVVDQLHEFELGVWKSLFKHLVRILEAAGPEKVQVLNER